MALAACDKEVDSARCHVDGAEPSEVTATIIDIESDDAIASASGFKARKDGTLRNFYRTSQGGHLWLREDAGKLDALIEINQKEGTCRQFHRDKSVSVYDIAVEPS